MSHRSERTEKTCLNCNAFIYGRYCHKCGQENVEPHESFWHLVTHFVYDVTHFDGKFFSTAKYLLFKPGFLSKEYIKGRRMSYLNPIRMYVFTSAIFFIFFFSIVKPEDTVKINKSKKTSSAYNSAKIKLEQDKLATETSLHMAGIPDSSKKLLSDKLVSINRDIQRLQKDSSGYKEVESTETNTLVLDDNYRSIEQYDSAQNKLPRNERDNWINKKLKHRKIFLDQKYEHNVGAFLNDLSKQFLHSFPQLFFVSLPLIALILKLLYVRRRNLYYSDHVIYLIHVYCAMFILLFFRLSFSQLKSFKHMGWLSSLNTPLILLMLFYVYKSLRNFYTQRRAKTILKFSLLMFLSSLVLSLLFLVYGVISLFTV